MDAYVGEIRIFAGNFAPKNWALCNGQILPISSYTTLFSILGINYGGDGKTTFALPNLNGSAPMGQGAGPGLTPRAVGGAVGTQAVTLLESQMPAHTHIPQAVGQSGNSNTPVNNYWSETPAVGRPPVQTPIYDATINTQMSPAAAAPAGGSQPHNNMQPFLVMNYIICIYGIYPPRG